ncbi:MAG TPA: hypothetical protein VHA52_00585, partial [Candidatus Babeliaceae bacterium]|nr:hypothetical protein [Candidatus Babeliaceae bacterium]
IQRAIAEKNFWFEKLRDQEQQGQVTLQDVGLKLRFEIKPVAESSSLKKIQSIAMQRVQAEWQQQNNAQTDIAISMAYQPKEGDNESRI